MKFIRLRLLPYFIFLALIENFDEPSKNETTAEASETKAETTETKATESTETPASTDAKVEEVS